jgi:hypothetical protein
MSIDPPYFNTTGGEVIYDLSKKLFFIFMHNGPTNPHWASMVGYGSFSLCVIHKEGMSPSSGDINRLMMIIVPQEKG